MEFKNLFKAVVLGGSVLSTGCGGAGSAVQGDAPPPADSPKALEAPAKRAAPEPPPPSAAKAPDLGGDCAKVCHKASGGEMICPQPDKPGVTNCCWLMLRRHACCPR